MSDIHDEMIKERERAIDALQAQIKCIQSEIDVLEEAQRKIKFQRKSRQPQKTLKLGESWTRALCFINTLNGASIDELAEYFNKRGHVIKRDALRARAHHLVKSGMLVRCGPGFFNLTDLGREKAEAYLTNNQDADGGQ